MFVYCCASNPVSRKGYLEFFDEQEGVWIRKFVVIRRPYILIYSSEKDTVRIGKAPPLATPIIMCVVVVLRPRPLAPPTCVALSPVSMQDGVLCMSPCSAKQGEGLGEGLGTRLKAIVWYCICL